jgi:DNA polymerase-1
VLDRKLEEIGMTELYYNIEMPLCAVLTDMEKTGFAVDKKALYEFGESLNFGIAALQKSIWEQAGEEFNINSPKQLGTVLFERLMLPAGRKTKTGWSTNVDVLESLTGKHPIIRDILDYRQLTKLKSTYVDGLLKVIGPDGRIHTSFQMTVTATGRLSSTEPNLQNYMSEANLVPAFGKCSLRRPERYWSTPITHQIEMRLLAHISGDRLMREAFISGEDIHSVTASQVFNVPTDQVTPLQRSRAKAVNFGIVYGISDFSLAQDIGVYRSEAKDYIEAYFSKYSGVRNYMKNVVEQAKKDEYVSTLFGRRRWLPELKSSNYNIRSFGERVALNMPIQGTAADIIKIAMIKVHRRLSDAGMEAKLILQVHDELIVECPENEAEEVARVLTEEMQGAVSYSVPLEAEAHSGRSWYEAK